MAGLFIFVDIAAVRKRLIHQIFGEKSGAELGFQLM
jgi:hypothetical protein